MGGTPQTNILTIRDSDREQRHSSHQADGEDEARSAENEGWTLDVGQRRDEIEGATFSTGAGEPQIAVWVF